MLNKSTINLENFNVTSILLELQLPDIVNDLELKDDVIDLKRLLYERNNGYANMVNTRLDKHSSMLDNFLFLLKTNNLRRLIG